MDSPTLAAALTGAALFASELSCVRGAMQVFEVWSLGMWIAEILDGMRAAANLAQSNNLATLIGFGAVGLLLLREQRRIGAAAAIALLLVLLGGLSLTQSRMALLFGPVIVLGVWLARRHGQPLRTPIRLLVGATGLAW